MNLLFFTAPLLPSGAHKTRKLALTPDQSDGGTSTNGINPTQTTAERRQRGEEIVSELTNGVPRPSSLDALERDFPFLFNAVNAFAVGEIFNRTVLDVKTRQLALCTAFAALGLTDYLKVHAGYALNHGTTEDEIREIANIVIVPGGFPRAIMASQAIGELLATRSG